MRPFLLFFGLWLVTLGLALASQFRAAELRSQLDSAFATLTTLSNHLEATVSTYENTLKEREIIHEQAHTASQNLEQSLAEHRDLADLPLPDSLRHSLNSTAAGPSR